MLDKELKRELEARVPKGGRSKFVEQAIVAMLDENPTLADLSTIKPD